MLCNLYSKIRFQLFIDLRATCFVSGRKGSGNNIWLVLWVLLPKNTFKIDLILSLRNSWSHFGWRSENKKVIIRTLTSSTYASMYISVLVIVPLDWCGEIVLFYHKMLNQHYKKWSIKIMWGFGSFRERFLHFRYQDMK